MIALLLSSRDRLLFLFGLYTGFRAHELLAIRWTDVWRSDQPASELTLARCRQKGGRGRAARRVRARSIPVHPTLQAALQTYCREQFAGARPAANEFLFKSRKGANAPISVRHAWRILKTAARGAGCEARVATHSMRKTFARAIYDQSGHDLVLTQRALNHSAITTTSRYLESTQEEVSAAVLRIGGLLHSLGDTPAAPNLRTATG